MPSICLNRLSKIFCASNGAFHTLLKKGLGSLQKTITGIFILQSSLNGQSFEILTGESNLLPHGGHKNQLTQMTVTTLSKSTSTLVVILRYRWRPSVMLRLLCHFEVLAMLSSIKIDNFLSVVLLFNAYSNSNLYLFLASFATFSMYLHVTQIKITAKYSYMAIFRKWPCCCAFARH